MTSDSYQTPRPGRRDPDKGPSRSGARRPLRRSGNASGPNSRRPSRKALTWTASILGLLVIAIAILIAVWDWNWFRGPLARAASAHMHREVTIDGPLKVHLFSWQPRASVEGVHIANPAWAGKDHMADIGRISIQIRLLPLFGGHLDMRLLRFDQPTVVLLRDAKGRATWDFSDGKAPAKPASLPVIRDFVINDGHLTYTDVGRKLKFTGTLSASEEVGAKNRGFEMRGDGKINAAPFTMAVTGGPLLNIDRTKPYPFNADIRAGQTYVTARGAVPKPFEMGQFYMNTTVRGPDLEQLYDIVGVALPNTPPYKLHGRLSRDGDLWKIDDLGGLVGSSDLGGDVSMKAGGVRPFVKANLKTRSLDFTDLGALFGGASKVGKVASPNQIAAAKVLKAQQRLLPDATLQTDRIRSVDADVTYSAASIHNAPTNLRSASAHVTLNAGLLRADPIAFELPQGRVTGQVQLDARNALPVTDLDLRLSNAAIERLTPAKAGAAPPITGALVGRAKLRGSGNSVHRAFANANGEMMVVIPGGEIRKSFAELAGVNVVKGLGLLLSKSQETTPIRCGVAHFQAVNGLFTADHLVFDTGPTLVTGSGTINMDTEKLDLTVQGHPKKFQIVHVKVPVTAGGTLLNPKLGIDPGPAAAQGGVAAALGVFLSPLGSILPFIDPGLAKDANCAALLAEAKADGAPVKAAQVKTAKALTR